MITTRSSRRRIAALGATVALAMALTACASGTSSQSTSSGPLSLWVWGGAVGDSVTKAATTEFSKSDLKVSVIGGDFKQKLVTAFTAKSGLPSVSGVKGEDMPYFLQQADLFTDLSKVDGLSDLLKDFPKWKVAEATTSDGKVIGIPIDIGPTGLFYRADVLKAAGLPSTPDDVAAATSSWSDFYSFGKELKSKTGAYLEVNITDVFNIAMGQSTTKFVDKKGNFTGDSAAVKKAWDLAIEAKSLGLSAGLQDGSPDWAAAITEGSLPTVIGAAWHAGDIKSAAPDTSGDWQVTTTPGGSANIGGSFLTIPAGTKDVAGAAKLIKYLLSAGNEATSYSETGNFPAYTPALKESALTSGDDFFGGQKTADVFTETSKTMPTAYVSPYDSQVSAPFYTELTNVEAQGKNPDDAWNDAVKAAKSALAAAK